MTLLQLLTSRVSHSPQRCVSPTNLVSCGLCVTVVGGVRCSQMEALVCTVAAAARQALDVESCLLFVLDSSGEQLWSLSDGGEIVTRTMGVGLVGCCAAYNQVGVCEPSARRLLGSSFPRDTRLPPCEHQASTHRLPYSTCRRVPGPR